MHRDWYILVWRDEQFVVYAGLPICFDTQPSRDVFLVWASEKRKINRQLPWKGRLVSVRLPMNAANIDLHTLKIHMLATTVDARCVKSFSAQRAKAKLGQNTRVGEVAMASTLILGSSTTAEVAQNAHNAGNTWCKVAISSAHWSPLHWHRIMQAKEKQTETRGGSPACVGPSPLPAIRLFIDSGQWAANRSYWCTVSPCSEHQVTASSYKENLVSNPKSNLEARKTFAKKDPHLVSELWLFFKMHASIFQNSSHIQQHW